MGTYLLIVVVPHLVYLPSLSTFGPIINALPLTAATADELSMHLATGLVMHQVYSFNEPPEYQRKVFVAIVAVLVPFFIYHCIADEFLMHTLVFGAMITMVARKTRRVIQQRITSSEDRKKLRKLAAFGTCKPFIPHVLASP
jgi:hypothetical protein